MSFTPKPRLAKGSITIVGTGIAAGQITVDAQHYIEHAQCLLALVSDPITLAWMKEVNSTTESLQRFYVNGKPRRQTYDEIVEYVLALAREGKDVCLALYGPPGVFATPSHKLIHRAAKEQIRAQMLPGVSAEDCLFADLGVDPGDRGCQSFEATDFLLRQRPIDPTSGLILWQFGLIGERSLPARRRRRGVKILADRLAAEYGAAYEVIIYSAAIHPVCKPTICRVSLKSLAAADYTIMCTLYVPPLPNREVDPSIACALGLRDLRYARTRCNQRRENAPLK